MEQLGGKTVVITGASRGIGAAAARAFAAAGANVVLAARSEAAVHDLAAEIGERARAIACDVADYDQVAAAVDLAVRAFGGLDVMINNAGVINPVARMEHGDPGDWAGVIATNLVGVYNGMRAALPVMAAAGGGTVITISSGAASNALEGWSHYCASKAGAKMLTDCLHKEAEGQGLRAIGLSPGTVATEMQVHIKDSGINPVSQLDPSVHIPADWVADALVFLATEAADDLVGTEVSLRDPEIRRRVGVAP
ncbi:MAG: SDR family oxidoreductase [Pseudomonadota bacterium]